jgi:CDP-6-deoxy-D-xylo-4-hexulose-3-dehydrase
LFIIEDSCEAHGAEFKGRKVGSFGDISTFSFFFSHHISTMEGGMLLTNNEQYAELAKGLRVFGWIRDLKDKDKIAKRYKGIDPRFLFINIGYNFRPTELQGSFGIHQMKKLEKFIEIRRENAYYWHDKLKKYSEFFSLHEEKFDMRHVWFGYPVIVNAKAGFKREELVDFLEGKGLETRPIMAGNIIEQPAMKLAHYRKVGYLPNSRLINRNAFFFGNHQGIGKKERAAIVSYFDEFVNRRNPAIHYLPSLSKNNEAFSTSERDEN